MKLICRTINLDVEDARGHIALVPFYREYIEIIDTVEDKEDKKIALERLKDKYTNG